MLRQLHVDVATARALHIIVRTPQWDQVKKYLETELDNLKNKLVDASDKAAICELQGRSKFLIEFLNSCACTQETVDKLEKLEQRYKIADFT